MTETTFQCPYCTSDLTKPESVVRAFWVKNTDEVAYGKAHYQATACADSPEGTTCIDSHDELEMDDDVHDDNDKCASCNNDVCADTIKAYAIYLSECNDGHGNHRDTGQPLLSYEDWH